MAGERENFVRMKVRRKRTNRGTVKENENQRRIELGLVERV